MNTSEENPMFDFGNMMHSVESGVVSLINLQREKLPRKIDYVQFILPSSMPALPTSRNFIEERFFGKPPLSLLEFEVALDRIANDSRPRGVILFLRGFAMSLADLQSLRETLVRFKKRGKRVVCYAHEYSLAMYYVASVADELIVLPSGGLMTTGLLIQQTYLKDGLSAIGIEWETLQITPYKTGYDTFARNAPSPEGAEMTNWLLDSQYEILIEGIANGRDMSADQVRALIDNSPMTDKEALEKGYLTGISTEEGLRAHLKAEHILMWDDADGVLPLKMPRPRSRYIGVLYLEGTILEGESGEPPVDLPVPIVGGPRIGDLAVVRQIRNLMQDDACAALVLYINSPGGSATASEAICSALDEWAKERPLVAYMGGVAASGGYYLATAADYIIAQAGTITGSIGVLAGKPINGALLKKMHLNAVTYQRGKNSGILDISKPFSEEEHGRLWAILVRAYERFTQRVSESRKLKPETIETLAGGRVWTGKQALEHGLVDALGGLQDALTKARELAKLPDNTPFGVVEDKGSSLPAQLAQQVNPAATLRYWAQTMEQLSGTCLMLLPIDYNVK